MRRDRQLIESVLKSALTVRELREQLDNYADDNKVAFVHPYGDIGNTLQLLPVTDTEEFDGELSELVKTAYSDTKVAVQDRDADEEEDDETREEDLVLIRCGL